MESFDFYFDLKIHPFGLISQIDGLLPNFLNRCQNFQVTITSSSLPRLLLESSLSTAVTKASNFLSLLFSPSCLFLFATQYLLPLPTMSSNLASSYLVMNLKFWH